MNKLIKEQLSKVKIAEIGEYNDDTTEIFISKYKKDVYYVGKYYLISLDDTLLNNYSNPVLVSNWNNNTFPKHKYMKVEIIKFIGKMISVNGIGFDYDNNTNTQDTWSGWLPISMIKQIKVL